MSAQDVRLDTANQRLRQRLDDEALERDGLLDAGQPTQTADNDWRERTFGEFKPGEFTPLERALIRAEYRPEETRDA